jgi:sterol desaturase/sphingolipid hydroxylase (fatty acid hydroxylase superfamily)
MTALGQDLEAAAEHRRIGTGWISGVLALVQAVLGLGAVLCLRYPELLTVQEARALYDVPLIRLALQVVLLSGFALAIVSIVLRTNKILGFTAMGGIMVATALGGSQAENRLEVHSDVYLGLDWLMLNLILTGIVFIPIERILKRREQPIFRQEWREDLLYFTISSLLVQVLTYLSMFPAMTILAHTEWGGFRQAVASQPVVLQFLEIMLLTDLVQYWVHRAFHRIPFLWNFHAIHHSAEVIDWLASSRMHVVDILFLRSSTVIPMYVLGFSNSALYAYVIFVYFLSAMVHSNVRLRFRFIDLVTVTPRFHHWHHGIEKEAIDVNFAIHFPALDWLFGTYHLPADGRWPEGYGVSQPPPRGFIRQMLYPFCPSLFTRPEASPATGIQEPGVLNVEQQK